MVAMVGIIIDNYDLENIRAPNDSAPTIEKSTFTTEADNGIVDERTEATGWLFVQAQTIAARLRIEEQGVERVLEDERTDTQSEWLMA